MDANSQQPDHGPITSDVANCQGEIPTNPLGNQYYGDWSKDSDISVPMTKSVKPVTEKCLVCLKNNPMDSNRLSPWITKRGNTSRDYWQIVFLSYHTKNDTDISWYYLLDTFSRWPEVFPCCPNKARKVTKLLLKEIIPRFGVPIGMPSDRGPHFISEVFQQLSKKLGINWDLHTPWRLQSSGRVEWLN